MDVAIRDSPITGSFASSCACGGCVLDVFFDDHSSEMHWNNKITANTEDVVMNFVAKNEMKQPVHGKARILPRIDAEFIKYASTGVAINVDDGGLRGYVPAHPKCSTPHVQPAISSRAFSTPASRRT